MRQDISIHNNKQTEKLNKNSFLGSEKRVKCFKRFSSNKQRAKLHLNPSGFSSIEKEKFFIKHLSNCSIHVVRITLHILFRYLRSRTCNFNPRSSWLKHCKKFIAIFPSDEVDRKLFESWEQVGKEKSATATNLKFPTENFQFRFMLKGKAKKKVLETFQFSHRNKLWFLNSFHIALHFFLPSPLSFKPPALSFNFREKKRSWLRRKRSG